MSGSDETVSTVSVPTSHITKISAKVQVLAVGGLLCSLGQVIALSGLPWPIWERESLDHRIFEGPSNCGSPRSWAFEPLRLLVNAQARL